MTAGDIDDKLGPAGELERLRQEHQDLDEYLLHADELPILAASCPYGAGISKDGQRRYIDPRLQTELDGVDLKPALAEHETVEWGVRQYCKIGLDYAYDPRGHRLANRAEYNKVAELFPDLDPDEAWEVYDEFLDPQLKALENLDIPAPAKDLDMYPYVGTAMYGKIRKAQKES